MRLAIWTRRFELPIWQRNDGALLNVNRLPCCSLSKFLSPHQKGGGNERLCCFFVQELGGILSITSYPKSLYKAQSRNKLHKDSHKSFFP